MTSRAWPLRLLAFDILHAWFVPLSDNSTGLMPLLIYPTYARTFLFSYCHAMR
ncbi:hypothetical protein PAXRUDRAFT_830700 [Paxillus rubicundulus Ve08.2h10]|uniref:Uncharacterized protein n=1 Tax=Paxillus rubicundulus Ve08.2h10 TaxID=930991 RepID=A0A0D0DYC1_9AGAM|nr:hypothetical protein PAXRUDRAFT_830700 [Paxillus rubicundulus Ve08.2h10]